MKIWCIPPIFALSAWLFGGLMPWEHPWLFPIQTILLTCPLWCGFIWLPLSLAISNRNKWVGFQRALGFSLPLALVSWSLGVLYPVQANLSEGQSLVFANVNAFAPRQELLQKKLGLMGAEHIIVVEKRAEEIENMVRVSDDFAKPVKRLSHHTAVFCRKSCETWVSPQIGSKTMAMSIALVRFPDDICVVGIHVPPPTPIDATGMRPYIDYITSVIENGRLQKDWEVCKTQDRVLVVGDLNAVSGSWAYEEITGLGLIDAQKNSGIWGATWPSDSDDFVRMPLFRIDHVFHHPDIRTSVKQIRIPDSDHQGLRVQFEL